MMHGNTKIKNHQSCSTTRTDLLAMPHDVQGDEGKNRSRSLLQYLCKKKEEH